MNVVLLRVGIDTGSGGIHAPLFADGTFQFMHIPDKFGGPGVDERTYGNTLDSWGRRPLVEYFPERKRAKMHDQPMHFDPEFETFTYGDPTRPKAVLRNLERGDYLVFYSGLEGYDCHADPALYIVGYFVVEWAGLAPGIQTEELHRLFHANFHVRHETVFRRQRSHLVLVKGGSGSRLLERPVLISTDSVDRSGRRLKVLSPEMQRTFGDLRGRLAIQRSTPRWIESGDVPRATQFLAELS